MEKDIQNTAGIRKIAIVGPECTGKSTLAQALATQYDTIWVPEFAREYIDQLDRPYHQDDLLQIAKGQLALEDELEAKANKLLICDTTLLVIKVWSAHKYQSCDVEITELLNERYYDFYLLTTPDLPWEHDPQREHPHLRKYFFEIYKKELEAKGALYQTISGSINQRIKQAKAAIARHIMK